VAHGTCWAVQVGRHHGFSGGLLIGGRQGVESERSARGPLNILVATPGRLLQHMDETPNFDCAQLQVPAPPCPFPCPSLALPPWQHRQCGTSALSKHFFPFSVPFFFFFCNPLQMLVLDEARPDPGPGLRRLPERNSRQPPLGTPPDAPLLRDPDQVRTGPCTPQPQEPRVRGRARDAKTATPVRLQQTVMIVPLDRKMDVLCGFLKSHTQSKILVFLSSCKQVQKKYCIATACCACGSSSFSAAASRYRVLCSYCTRQ